MLHSVIKFFSKFLIFVLIIDPGDLIFRLKTPLFIMIFISWFLLKTFQPIAINKDTLFACLIFLIIPVFGICSAIVQNTFADPTFALGFTKSFLIITLLIVVVDLEIPLANYLNRLCILIPLIIIPIYISFSTNPNLALQIDSYLDAKDVAKFSNRNYYGYEVLMLYYRTSPLLLFPLAYYSDKLFDRKKFTDLVLVFLFLFTLILSGTRANMLSAVVIVVYFLFVFLLKKKNKLPLFMGCIIVVLALLYFFKTLSFAETDESSTIKSGHLDSYVLLFRQHPQYLIWGSGLGSTFYTSGTKAVASQTELTYLDLIRWFGIPLTIVIFVILLYPVLQMYFSRTRHLNNRYIIIAYWGYLFIVGTNPLLVSSTGMLVIVIMYSLLGKKRITEAQGNSPGYVA